MITRVIQWSLRNRFLVVCGFLLLMGFGFHALRTTPIDAIPDLSENQVIVFADWPGRSPKEVEDQITYPLTVGLQGLTGVKEVRAISMFGFSLLTVIFEDGIDNYFARTRILERLNFLTDSLPSGVSPRLGPDATGLGWVYQYYLDVDPAKAPQGGYDLGTLRSLQDYYIRYQLASVKGVSEVASVGGFVRQMQISVSSLRMRDLHVRLQEVMDALGKANLNVGGKVIEENGREFVVRGVGLVESIEDLENIVVREEKGVPILMKDLGTVKIGGDFRRGTLDVDGREVVGGIVVMRTGENAREVIRLVKEKIAAISSGLPTGVSLRPTYDRSTLIDRTVETLKHALMEEILLVTLAHVFFLWHFRSILIVTIPLPASILIAFFLMKEFGVTSNIMSLSGIAIAIGVLVDAGIVMTENVLRRCEIEERTKGGRLSPQEVFEITLRAAPQVGRPIFLSMLIIILAFLPVFALTGQEGKLFHPLAWTKTFAMVGATLLAVTVVPVLCTFWVRGPFHAESENIVMRFLLKIYRPVLDWALAHRVFVFTLAGSLLGLAALLAFGLPRKVQEQLDARGLASVAKVFSGMGSEFMPPLDEGALLFMPVFLPGTSLTEMKQIMSWQDRVLRTVPEVVSAAGKLGRAETATDPAPVEMIETTIELKPRSEWRRGMTREKLVAEMSEKLSVIPGYVPGFLQPIENRLLMLSTGIRAQVGVKIIGSDLDTIQRLAFDVEKLLREVPGAVGVAASRTQGKPYLEVLPDRFAIAQHGLTVEDVMDYVETGVGGVNVTHTLQGRERIPIQLRLQGSERDDVERLGDILVGTPSGNFVPLGQIASIRRTTGPNEIQSENAQLRVFVQANVQGRDLGGFVKEARRHITEQFHLPEGVTLEWSGQFENQIRAKETLQWIIPTALLIIFILLVVTFRSIPEAAHVLLAVPFALTGGVFFQWLLGYPFSVAVWVGYIALFGTAIQTGVIMVIYLEEAVERKKMERGEKFNDADLVEAVREGAFLRLRPKVMTVATVVASLLPIFWSTRVGTEVMRPLAAPVLGGMISSLIHILIVTPVVFLWLRKK